MSKVTVIVPIYKVEKELPRCLNSIINQTYKNLEIILVDDGSPDKCGEICENYAKGDSRIKVIHKKNGGLSSARNAGLEIASGEYVCFIDSDDYIAENFVEELYTASDKNDADISQCGYLQFSGEETFHIQEMERKFKILKGEELIHSIYTEGIPAVVICNKLFKRELFKNIRFPDGKIHEDEAVIHELYYVAKKKIVINLPLYYYVSRNDSITKSKIDIKRLDTFDALEGRYYFFVNKEKPDLFMNKCIVIEIFSYFMHYYALNKSYFVDKKKFLTHLNAWFKKIRQDIFLKEKMRLDRKIVIYLSYISFSFVMIYAKIIKRLGKIKSKFKSN